MQIYWFSKDSRIIVIKANDGDEAWKMLGRYANESPTGYTLQVKNLQQESGVMADINITFNPQ